MASNQLQRDHAWPYLNWVNDRIRKYVRFRLLSPWAKKSKHRNAYSSVDEKVLKTLLTNREYQRGWKTVAKRIEGRPLEWVGDRAVDPMLFCLLSIARLPNEYKSYRSLPRNEARAELHRLAEKADDLQKQLSRSAYLDRYMTGGTKFFEAHLQSMRRKDRDSLPSYIGYASTSDPPQITDLLRALADYLHTKAEKRKWQNKSKEQFMIDGVLTWFNVAFGFGYPSFAAKVATLLCGGPHLRKGKQDPTPIPIDVVLKRAAKLKIPAR